MTDISSNLKNVSPQKPFIPYNIYSGLDPYHKALAEILQEDGKVVIGQRVI